MRLKYYKTVPAAFLALGLLVGLALSVAAQSALTTAQSDAQSAYSTALKHFKAVLRERRAEHNARQALPNLPGQALYLARNATMSTYKDLTDALPSKVGRPNK